MPEGEKKVEHYTTPIKEEEREVENAANIFKEDYQRIFRYIMSMVRDTEEAEDLTQETFLRAYQRRDSLRDEGAFFLVANNFLNGRKFGRKRHAATKKGLGKSPNPLILWSGKRDSNPRPSAWEADTLPLSYSRAARCRV